MSQKPNRQGGQFSFYIAVAELPSLTLGLPTRAAHRFCGDAPLLLIIRSDFNIENIMAFWRRKKDEQFVSLGLGRAAAEPAPPTPQQPTAAELPTAPIATETSEATEARAPWQTSVLGLNLSIEELQAREAALEQELSKRSTQFLPGPSRSTRHYSMSLKRL